MGFPLLTIAKLLVKGGAFAAFAFSGKKITDILREKKINYSTVSGTIVQEQKAVESVNKNTVVTFYDDRQMYVETSIINRSDAYLYDHVHERDNEECIYYIINSDNKNIRVSKKKPTGVKSGIYRGRKLNEFTWKNEKFYGYCSPKDSPLGGEECSKIPDGWNRTEIE